MKLSGCFTAIVTPFDSQGHIDETRLREQIAFQIEAGVSGIVPCGTTGESPTLSEKEWELVVSTAVELTRGTEAIVIAGTGCNNTAHAVAMQKKAANLGADAGLSVNPYYNKPNQDGLRRHFSAVAQAANISVVLYNIPGRTGVALAPATIAQLGKDHPNIVAVKEATGSLDSVSDIASRCDITILSGDDSMTLPFASVGATGVVSVVSNILPQRVGALCSAFNGGDWARARELHLQLFNLCRALLSLDTNPIPIKAAMHILGRDSGALRLPMVSANTQTVKVIEGLLKKEGMFEGVGV